MPKPTASPSSHLLSLRSNRLRPALWLSAAFVLVAVLLYGRLLHADSVDLRDFLRPWFEQIATRGFPALAGEYANYTPPYLYLLALADLFGHGLSDTVLIKAPSIVGNAASAVLVGLIMRHMGRDVAWSLLAAGFFLLLPTVVLNSVYWGQSDIVYTTFLLAFLLATLKRQPLLAVLCFGVALSFKMQSIFLGPYVLYLLLRREIPWRYIALIPVVYGVAMVPAWLAGRPWGDLLLIYAAQGGYYQELSRNAPNLYTLAQRFGLDYHAGVLIGLVAATIAGLALSVYGQKLRAGEAEAKLLVATASALLMPFLLPKMHDRYFFVADVFSFTLACATARFWWLAGTIQAASAAAYLRFLFGVYRGPYVGALLSTMAVLGMAWLLYGKLRPNAGTAGQPRSTSSTSAASSPSIAP